MTSSRRQIRVGAIISYIGILFGFVTGLLYNPWMIKEIGSSDYGLYTLAMSLVNTFLVDFGLSVATQRYVSKYLAEENQQAVNDVIGLILKLYFVIAIALSVIFFVIYFLIDKIYLQLTDPEMEKFKILYIMVAVYSVTSFPFVTLNGIMSSYERFIALKTFDLLFKFISITLIVIALINGGSVYVLVLVNLFTSILITLLKIITIKKETPVKINFSFYDFKQVKELFGFSVWSSVSTMIMRLFITLGPSILGIVSGSIEIAVFGYAVSLEAYIYTFVNAVNGFFLPKLSRISIMDNNTSEQQVLDLMVSVGRFILGLYALIYIGFMALGRQFIEMIIGVEYLDSYLCTLLICAYGIVAYPQQIANTYTLVMNKVKKRAFISVIAMGVYIILAFPLGRVLGSKGVCLAICIALCVQTLFLNFMYKRDLHIDIKEFFKRCHLRSLPGIMILCCAAFSIAQLSLNGWTGFIIKVIFIVISFGVITYFSLLEKQERKKAVNLITRRG